MWRVLRQRSPRRGSARHQATGSSWTWHRCGRCPAVRTRHRACTAVRGGCCPVARRWGSGPAGRSPTSRTCPSPSLPAHACESPDWPPASNASTPSLPRAPCGSGGRAGDGARGRAVSRTDLAAADRGAVPRWTAGGCPRGVPPGTRRAGPGSWDSIPGLPSWRWSMRCSSRTRPSTSCPLPRVPGSWCRGRSARWWAARHSARQWRGP